MAGNHCVDLLRRRGTEKRLFGVDAAEIPDPSSGRPGPLPMDQWDELIFREALRNAISKRTGIGDALAEGVLEAAKRWGRLDEDMKSGALRFPAWGSLFHWTLPCIEWSYGCLLGAGDPTWHAFFSLGSGSAKSGPPYTCEPLVEMMASKVIPYTGDPLMF